MRKMYKFSFLIFILLFTAISTIKSQTSTLSPEAATIWDAYFPDGGHRANSDRLFPVIPTIGYNPEATSQSFYFDTDIDLYKNGITELHSRGMQYYMFLPFYYLETTMNSLMATDPLITDRYFGVVYDIDGSMDTNVRSINRPAYRDFFIRCIKRGIDAGADGIQIDMAGEQFVTSFDPDDVSAFRTYMKENYSSTVWTSQGVGNIDTLDYREWIYDKGFTTFPQTFDLGPSDPPLAKYWILFKFNQIQNSWKYISDTVKTYAFNKYGRDFTIIGNNAYFGGFSQHGIYTMGDVCGEYFGYSNKYPLKGTTTTTHKALQGFGKRHLIWSVPWNDGDCNCQNEEFDLHMAAESFACGGLAQFAGEKIERDLYAKYFYLIQRQRELFNKVVPSGEVAVLLAMPTTICAWGIMDPHFGAQLLMQDIGRSYDVVIGGTNLGWPDSLKLTQLTKYKMVLVHEAIRLTNNQVNVLLAYANQGGKLMVLGTGLAPGFTGALDENGNTRTNPTWQNMVTGSTKITNYGTGKVIFIKEDIDASDGYGRTYYRYNNSGETWKENIASNIRNKVKLFTDSVLSKENIRFTLPQRVMIFRSEDTTSRTMVYHLINCDVDTVTRLHSLLTNKIVKLDLINQLELNDSVAVTILNPDNPEGVFLGNLKVDSGRVAVNIPELFIWDIIKIEQKHTINPVIVKDLSITNAIQSHKIKYNSKPHFAWKVDHGTQQEYQLQVWNNSTFYGTPIYDSDWITSADTFHTYTLSNLINGISYLTRVRIKNAGNDTSEWTMNTFHVNNKPEAPTHLYGISSVIETRSNVPFWWAEARDPEGDSLVYFWELHTDSLFNNTTDSTNLYFVYSSPYSWHKPELLLDGIFDTLKATLNIDNYGFWWKAFSFDGLDTSDASRWARFTWDHIDDPPKAFNLLNPSNASNIKTQQQFVNFTWETNGDIDPNTPSLNSYDLIFSENPIFSTILDSIANISAPPFVLNPFITQAHKLIFWRVRAHDQTNNKRLSNQTFRLYIDPGTNTAPTKPILIEPCNNCNADTSSFLKWQLSTDNQLDSIFYTLEIDSTGTFTSPFIVVNNIFDITTPSVEKKLKNLPNFSLIKIGRPYYWRVKAYDQYYNGISQYSTVYNFTFTNQTVNNEAFSSETIQIKLFPNPVKDELIIITDNLSKPLNIEIINSSGQCIYRSILNNKMTYNTQKLPNGIYQIKFISENSFIIKSFIKE